jgi:hypothetical protein
MDHVQVERVERLGPVEDNLLPLAQRLHQHLGLHHPTQHGHNRIFVIK